MKLTKGMFRTSLYLFTGRFKFHSGKGVCLSFTSSGEWCILVLLRASRSKWRASRTGEKILSLDDCNINQWLVKTQRQDQLWANIIKGSRNLFTHTIVIEIADGEIQLCVVFAISRYRSMTYTNWEGRNQLIHSVQISFGRRGATSLQQCYYFVHVSIIYFGLHKFVFWSGIHTVLGKILRSNG